MKTTTIWFAIFAIAYARAHSTNAQVIYVKAGATGTGADWSNAEGSLQNAINSVGAMGQVWVAQGSYLAGANPGDSIALANQVLVIGGFFGIPGTETDPNARDPNPATNNTVLSGEIGGPGLADNIITLVSASQATITDTVNTVLDGFTLTAAARHAIDIGIGNSPTLSHLRFVSNGDGSTTTDYAGAGLVVGGGCNAIVDACEFTDNHASAGGAVDICGGRSSFNNCLYWLDAN